MFDQERFDELAKGLATNRLSRGQVIKSFAAGLLLAGPLGALWARPASAATCPACGACTVVSIDTASGTVTQAKCTGAIKCRAKSLCLQANKNARYRQLERYLKKEGFKAAGAPQAIVLRQDGKPVREGLETYYTNSTLGQKAMFTYAREASGQTAAWAVVAEGYLVKYVLVFSSDGKITEGLPPEEQPPTGAPASGARRTSSSVPEVTSTSSYAAAAAFDPSACKQHCLWLCEDATDLFCFANAAIWCSPAWFATPAAAAICAFLATYACSKQANAACDKYCSEEACKCPVGEWNSQDCGVCIKPCQSCQNGQIVAKECTTRCTKCNPNTNGCEYDPAQLCGAVCCPPGQICQNDQCVASDCSQVDCSVNCGTVEACNDPTCIFCCGQC